MKEILKCTKKYLPFLILTPIVLIIEVILEVKIPIIMSDIVDIAIPSNNIAVVAEYGKKMVIMAICSLLAGCAGSFLSSIGSIGFGSELRKAVFNKIQDFSFEDIDKFQQSSLLTRLTTDVTYVQQGLRMCLTMFIRAPFMMVAAAVTAYGINKDLFTIFLIAIPVIIILILVLGFIAVPLFKYMLSKFDGLNDDAKEYLTNVRTVKAYVRENFEAQKFKNINQDLLDSSIKIEGLLVLASPLFTIIVYAVVIAILWIGGNQVIVGDMLVGKLISFISYVGQILSGVIMMAMIFMNIVRLKGSVDRLSEVLNNPVILLDGNNDHEVKDGSIDFNHVSFKYNSSKNVINDIDIHIKAGETIGIIGSTGCGKSSLVQLIPRLYDANEGEVLVGGLNVKEYKLKKLRDNVAMVLQQNVLFSGTIKDNLKWGDINATDEEIIAACQKAQAHEFISSFPEGYETELGQGGVNVSGGQKQRLCIARALLKKPKIIILDDSTSAVDTHTDLEIRKALKEELKGTTTIIIAQRIASVMDADRVIVMENGKVVDVGTPNELLKHEGIYKDIFDTQMKGVDING